MVFFKVVDGVFLFLESWKEPMDFVDSSEMATEQR
jgi:hypothetical protein